MAGPKVPVDIRAVLQWLREDDAWRQAEYDAAPKCRNCGYPDYYHPFYGGLHRFNDDWAHVPDRARSSEPSAQPKR